MLFGVTDPEVIITWFGHYYILASQPNALPGGLGEKYDEI